MIRVVNFELDNLKVPFATLSTVEAEKFITEFNAMKAKWNGTADPEEWSVHTRQTVADALNRATSNGNADWTVEKVKQEFDMPSTLAFYLRIREASGIGAGEARADR